MRRNEHTGHFVRHTLWAALALLVAISPILPVQQLAPVAAAQTGTSDGALAVVGALGAPLHDEPDGSLIDTLSPGTVLNAFARTDDSSWIQVETDQGLIGWVETDAWSRLASIASRQRALSLQRSSRSTGSRDGERHRSRNGCNGQSTVRRTPTTQFRRLRRLYHPRPHQLQFRPRQRQRFRPRRR